MKKKQLADKPKESTGALFFFFSGLAVSLAVAVLFSIAGFLLFPPWLNIASAVLLAPAALTFLYRLFASKTRMEPVVSRVLTAAVSLLGAYVFVCVMTGVLSGVYGAWPVESAGMADTEIMEYIQMAPRAIKNGFAYLFSFGRLWQDLAAWSEGGWLMMAVAALLAQTGLPQLLLGKTAQPPAGL